MVRAQSLAQIEQRRHPSEGIIQMREDLLFLFSELEIFLFPSSKKGSIRPIFKLKKKSSSGLSPHLDPVSSTFGI